MFIEPELAGNIIPNEIRPGLSLASVTGELEVKDNVYTIKVFKFIVLFNSEINSNSSSNLYSALQPRNGLGFTYY